VRRQEQHVRHDVRELQALALRRRSLGQRAHAFDHGARAVGIERDVVERSSRLCEICRPPAREQDDARIGVVEDRGERLIDLVRDRRGELAERRDARRVGERGLCLPQRLVGAIPLGQVDERTEHVLVAGSRIREDDRHDRRDLLLLDRGEDQLGLHDPLPFGDRAQEHHPCRRELGRVQDGHVLQEILRSLRAEQPSRPRSSRR
jgi:hypothetical protein